MSWLPSALVALGLQIGDCVGVQLLHGDHALVAMSMGRLRELLFFTDTGSHNQDNSQVGVAFCPPHPGVPVFTCPHKHIILTQSQPLVALSH